MRKMKPYYFDFDTGAIRFYSMEKHHERIRLPRVRAQKQFDRFGGIPFVPFRIAHYNTPKFYYSNLMSHRRKLNLDQGIAKVINGIWFALNARKQD